MFKFLIGFFSILWIVSCSPVKNESLFKEQFDNLDTVPKSIAFTNEEPVNNEGGHLQGVQSYSRSGQDYAIVTGSSSTYSYYGVVRMNEHPQVISIVKILEKPFKHAGGFQIFEDYLAVGIEDNEERTRSKVYLFHLENPENPPKKPIAVTNREGAYERATAGAVGLTKVEDKYLLVVGDWDSRHLDFYVGEINDETNHPAHFRKVHTITTSQADKTNWSDLTFHSYQNLNLISTNNKELFLVGMGYDENQQNVADLFKLSTNQFKTFTIRKIASKTFESKNGANFRSGAGISFNNNRLEIISSSDHILEKSFLNVYSTDTGTE
ncbi:MAG: hypothetical protein GVY20_10075 [Bacteroidetes bacterium]|jgi:hypothetical protein|nr:hypothetical protein [Bacteroidota bacterium]